MDNRIFNINGQDFVTLTTVLKLAFEQERSKAAVAYIIDPKKGMILLWCKEGGIPFPSPLSAEAAANVVWEWLKSEPDTECVDWDADLDHDGHNTIGWRAYIEDWGRISTAPTYNSSSANRYAIVAVKPAYLWYGK